ncbi:BNR repeat-containing protein [Saccharobesus litoralis]|nr:BNR repeat-containing protein [Saccharobesus litoralis]
MDFVWSGHRIKPYLLTKGNNQFVAYFDANRQMTIAQREIGRPWRYYKVDSWLGWDSHNYVTLELDKAGHIHVMGNMHGDAMEYFRSSRPLDVRSLQRVPMMVDQSVELRMTYPIFLLNNHNELVVKYRDGGSGNGNEIYNIYNTETKQWRRLHRNQFLDGEGKMSGYFEGPIRDANGRFHLIWVWRNTPNAATNHSLSYAMSDDLIHWQDSNGKPIALPLTLDKTEVVDPVPAFGGMINGNVKLGFDHNNQPVIVYHKYDQQGFTQIYLARKSGKTWQSHKISQWQGFRWDFSGHGSLGRFQVKPYAPVAIDNNQLAITVRRLDSVKRFIVNGDTLETIRVENGSLYPPEILAKTQVANQHLLQANTLALEHHVFVGKGDLSPSGGQYYLSWYSQPGNRDRAHAVISPASVLSLHEVKQ